MTSPKCNDSEAGMTAEDLQAILAKTFAPKSGNEFDREAYIAQQVDFMNDGMNPPSTEYTVIVSPDEVYLGVVAYDFNAQKWVYRLRP